MIKITIVGRRLPGLCFFVLYNVTYIPLPQKHNRNIIFYGGIWRYAKRIRNCLEKVERKNRT